MAYSVSIHYLPDILALLIGVAGWYYLFYSRAAHKLGEIEDPQLNNRRVRLRRINGFVLLLLAIAWYAGFHSVDMEHPSVALMYIWFAVLFLLLLTVILGMIDLRLTMRLRRPRGHDRGRSDT
jgi:hypothetical protein